MKLSFIGLGVMGLGMGLNLAKGEQEGEYEFLACDAHPGPLNQFKEKGFNTTTNIEDTTDSDYIFLCLPNLEIVREVVLGENGLLKHLKSGQVIVDFSTISYIGVTEIADECQSKGIDFLDCPISGQEKKSLDGTLSIMCGGKEKIFNTVKPKLDRMGSQILYMGGNGAGQLTKMINNCALNICVASFSELMPVGVKLGLDPEKLGDVLMTATGSSFASKTLVPKVLEGNFEHGFSLERAYKDMESMYEVLVKEEIPLPTLNGTMQSYQLALRGGQRDFYKHAMIRFYEDMLDVKVRKEGFK
ncbi:NAD(P)-dependent oxidoreductase [Virgibacillus necropolis]|uniref:2-hydroxymethylglutarate dehydrogenase n=1 Tax=Virgibacillus necropolis TaxID=163877 RepID=A0A221MF79_9BACI|nr:NAD(P)-dependent oxidoreductase [Virgibacillus necropolis]ASN06318.1 2-hydroxymethylglutarate dehydrogenase [Virgibacillus necropolis]